MILLGSFSCSALIGRFAVGGFVLFVDAALFSVDLIEAGVDSSDHSGLSAPHLSWIFGLVASFPAVCCCVRNSLLSQGQRSRPINLSTDFTFSF